MGKETKSGTPELADALMHGKDLQIGKEVRYFLLDEEFIGGVIREDGEDLPERTCRATVDYVYPDGHNRRTNPNEPYYGTIFVDLSIDRRLKAGGFFQKEKVPFTDGRDPGTCQSVQTADVGL